MSVYEYQIVAGYATDLSRIVDRLNELGLQGYRVTGFQAVNASPPPTPDGGQWVVVIAERQGSL